MKDTYHDTKVVQSIAPVSLAASLSGAGVDIAGFDSALVAISTGVLAASTTYTAKLQESDTLADADFVNVAPDDMLGTLPEALVGGTVYRVGYIGSNRKRYIRVVVTKVSGTSIVVGANVILGHPAIAPVA